MDSLRFIAEIIKALAWPATTVVLVILLRKPVVELIPLLSRLKYKEFELEFAREMSELKAEAESMAKEKSPYEDVNSSRLLDLVSYSTHAAILEAWFEVESAAVSIASSFWGQSATDSLKTMPNLGEYLLQCNIIDRSQLDIYNKLRKLRNRVAHAKDLNLDKNDARSYIRLAINLADHIRGAKI
ncbi:hypothetical protein D0U00_17160 [Leclercia adecarboxylata]|nr:hypothetical protein D0U00_17160 [Leclercia adecarboxylata]